MKVRSHVLPKRQRGRPPGPARTDAFREKLLLNAIASAHRGLGIQLLPIVKRVIDANDGPRDEHEVRRIYESYRSDFERPQQYDRACHLNAPIGTRVWIRADSPDWVHVGWNGWFPVKGWADGKWIIERQSARFLTQEEGEEQASKEFARMLIGMGSAECDAIA